MTTPACTDTLEQLVSSRIGDGMTRTLRISLLLFSFGFWVSPGVAASLCTAFVGVLESGSQDHSHSHAEDADHAHSPSSESKHADECCFDLFADGAPEFTVLEAAGSDRRAPLLGPVDWNGTRAGISSGLFPSRPFQNCIQFSPPGLQRPIYALHSVYLI